MLWVAAVGVEMVELVEAAVSEGRFGPPVLLKMVVVVL